MREGTGRSEAQQQGRLGLSVEKVVLIPREQLRERIPPMYLTVRRKKKKKTFCKLTEPKFKEAQSGSSFWNSASEDTTVGSISLGKTVEHNCWQESQPPGS